MKNNETHLQDSTKKETMYITSLPERAIFWTICLFILILLGRDGTLKDKPEIIVNNTDLHPHLRLFHEYGQNFLPHFSMGDDEIVE